MPRIRPIDPEKAGRSVQRMLDDVQNEWGTIPNVFRTLAVSPATLAGYLGLSKSLSGGSLSAELRELIAVTVAEANWCDYSLAAHCAVGGTIGLSQEAIKDARRGTSPDRKLDAALRFVRHVVEKRGWVDDADVARIKEAGYRDQEIVEILAHVAMSVLTNYVNHVAKTEIDFPRVEQLSGT